MSASFLGHSFFQLWRWFYLHNLTSEQWTPPRKEDHLVSLWFKYLLSSADNLNQLWWRFQCDLIFPRRIESLASTALLNSTDILKIFLKGTELGFKLKAPSKPLKVFHQIRVFHFLSSQSVQLSGLSRSVSLEEGWVGLKSSPSPCPSWEPRVIGSPPNSKLLFPCS